MESVIEGGGREGRGERQRETLLMYICMFTHVQESY